MPRNSWNTTMTNRLYNGLTRDTHKGALATAQAMHIRAVADDYCSEEIEKWSAECLRIETILNNWDNLTNSGE